MDLNKDQDVRRVKETGVCFGEFATAHVGASIWQTRCGGGLSNSNTDTATNA